MQHKSDPSISHSGIQYADDNKSTVSRLFRLRFPSLIVGLLLGIPLSLAASRFEGVLAHDVRVAFFIPFVVYMADAVGTQTESIYIRGLRTGQAKFRMYMMKETLLGLLLGVISSVISGIVALAWLHSPPIALAVGLSVLTAIFTAPIVALIVTEVLQLEHLDPAVGAGPIATVIQDTLSVLIYSMIASAVLL